MLMPPAADDNANDHDGSPSLVLRACCVVSPAFFFTKSNTPRMITAPEIMNIYNVYEVIEFALAFAVLQYVMILSQHLCCHRCTVSYV